MLEVSDLQKFFEGHDGQQVRAVDGVSISVEEGHMFTLLGPSGCGKTTMLRCIAGLERAHGGEISIGESSVFSHRRRINMPVHERDIGMVFQSYAIWPHMNVFRNVAFPLTVARKRPRAPRNRTPGDGGTKTGAARSACRSRFHQVEWWAATAARARPRPGEGTRNCCCWMNR